MNNIDFYFSIGSTYTYLSVTRILDVEKKHNVKFIGKIPDQLPWPVSRDQALELLEFFCSKCLPNFGRFQDAMATNHDLGWSLYHSRLSFALNSKMLSPKEVLNSALHSYETNKSLISIAQIEGFVRQVLGWREFIRALYWINMPGYKDKNYFKAKRKLPVFFWTGETKMACMRRAIEDSLQHSYSHHIHRLMITGNFCLLTGVSPDEVDNWYLGVYIDGIEDDVLLAGSGVLVDFDWRQRVLERVGKLARPVGVVGPSEHLVHDIHVTK